MPVPYSVNLDLGGAVELGAGAPDPHHGVNEDYYIDTLTGDLYRKHAGGYTVVANLQVAAGVQKRTVTITHADLIDAVNGEAQVINVGAILPADAVVLSHEVNVATLFSGGGATAVKLDVGGTAPTAIVDQMDVFTGAATGALSPQTGTHGRGSFSAEQLVATFTPDAGHTLLALTAGSLTITVYFAVVA